MSVESDGLGGYKPRKRQEAPVKAAGYSASNDPFYHLRQNNPTDPAEALRLWQEQQLRSRQLVLQQQAASAAAAASKTQREVYVGNLVAGAVTESALRQVFHSALVAAFPQADIPGLSPVVNVAIHSDGRYAFVELRNPEFATAALSLSGQVVLAGQPITVGRPSGYVDPSKAQLAAAQAAQALAQFQAGDASVAPLPGPGVVIPGVPPGALILETGTSIAPTPYVSVTGMVNADVLADDKEYLEVIEDLRDECGKYGQVYEVKIPRPPNPLLASSLVGTGNFGKAFVQFIDSTGAQKAKEAIHGRMFAGTQVQAVFVTAQTYATVR